MPNYAIIDNNIVTNVIVADTKELAEELTGLQVLETNGEPWINWVYIDTQWMPPKPYPSWILENGKWTAPIPKPEEGYWKWNEDIENWEESQ